MLGKNQSADSYKRSNGWKDDGPLGGLKLWKSTTFWLEKTMCYENAVIDSDAKNETAYDYVDNIEHQTKQAHDAQNPQPAQ